MKLPHQFERRDWLAYILTSIARQNGGQLPRWSTHDSSVAENALARCRREGADPYELAVALDQLARNWTAQREFYSLFSAGYVLHTTRQSWWLPPAFWRGVYFSRYARNAHEVAFYAQWLTELEAAEQGVDFSSSTQRLRAVQHLTQAEERIIAEDREAMWLVDFATTVCAVETRQERA
jgi:hypothetical protein